MTGSRTAMMERLENLGKGKESFLGQLIRKMSGVKSTDGTALVISYSH